MVPYHRPKSGHITCYLNRTYHVLLTSRTRALDKNRLRTYHRASAALRRFISLMA